MEFFRGLFSAVFILAVLISIFHFSRKLGIKQGRDMVKNESNLKIKRCHRILVSK